MDGSHGTWPPSCSSSPVSEAGGIWRVATGGEVPQREAATATYCQSFSAKVSRRVIEI